jgi:hypothetical protein
LFGLAYIKKLKLLGVIFMILFAQELPAPVKTIQETPLRSTQDPLIAKGLQKEQYFGVVTFAIVLIAAVGFISRRVEYAILFAFTLSIILILFFVLV